MKKIILLIIGGFLIFASSITLVATDEGEGWIPQSEMRNALYVPIKYPPEFKLIKCCYISTSTSVMCYGPGQSPECTSDPTAILVEL